MIIYSCTVLYLDEDLQPLQPVTVVMEEVLQFPDVLQQVGLSGRLTEGLLEQPRALRHPGHVLHQHLLPLRRNLGTRDWGGEGERGRVRDLFRVLIHSSPCYGKSPQIEYRLLSITTVSLDPAGILTQSRC